MIILGQTAPLSEPTLVPRTLPPMALPAETLLARYAFSQALSRSTALSALEGESAVPKPSIPSAPGSRPLLPLKPPMRIVG